MRLLLSSEYGVITGLIEADVKFDKDGSIKSGNITHHLSSHETLKTSFATKRGKMYVTSITCVNANNSSNSSVLYDQDNDKTGQSEIAFDGSETPESEKLRSDCETCLTELIDKAHELREDVPLVSEFLSSPLWEKSLSYVIKDVEPTASGRARKYAKTARIDLGCNINGGESFIVDLSYLPDGTIGKCRYIHWNNSVGTMVEIGDEVLKRISISSPTDGWDRVYDCRQQGHPNS